MYPPPSAGRAPRKNWNQEHFQKSQGSLDLQAARGPPYDLHPQNPIHPFFREGGYGGMQSMIITEMLCFTTVFNDFQLVAGKCSRWESGHRAEAESLLGGLAKL